MRKDRWNVFGAAKEWSKVGTITKTEPPPCDLCRKPSAFLLHFDSDSLRYRSQDILFCRGCLVGLRVALHDAENEG